MKRNIKCQHPNIQKKNSTFAWNKFLQISQVNEIREYYKNINKDYDEEIINESINKEKDANNIHTNKKENNRVVEIKNNNNHKSIQKEESISKKSLSNNDENNNTNNKISENINSEFKNIAYDPNGIINKNDAEIVEIKQDGNCLYRAISYFLFNDQNYFQAIKDIIIDRAKNNYEIYCDFFGDDEKNGIKKETLALKEFEYMKKKDSWGGDIQINIICIIFKLNICVFYENNDAFKRYFLFNIPNVENEELVLLLYVNHNHYNLIYPKRDNGKNNKIYNNPELIDKLKTSGISRRYFKISRPNNE